MMTGIAPVLADSVSTQLVSSSTEKAQKLYSNLQHYQCWFAAYLFGQQRVGPAHLASSTISGEESQIGYGPSGRPSAHRLTNTSCRAGCATDRRQCNALPRRRIGVRPWGQRGRPSSPSSSNSSAPLLGTLVLGRLTRAPSKECGRCLLTKPGLAQFTARLFWRFDDDWYRASARGQR